jgi:hypothetical protein
MEDCEARRLDWLVSGVDPGASSPLQSLPEPMTMAASQPSCLSAWSTFPCLMRASMCSFMATRRAVGEGLPLFLSFLRFWWAVWRSILFCSACGYTHTHTHTCTGQYNMPYRHNAYATHSHTRACAYLQVELFLSGGTAARQGFRFFPGEL